MDHDFYEIMLGFVAYMKEFVAFLCHIVVRTNNLFEQSQVLRNSDMVFFVVVFGHLKKYLSSVCLLQLGNSWLKTEKQS